MLSSFSWCSDVINGKMVLNSKCWTLNINNFCFDWNHCRFGRLFAKNSIVGRTVEVSQHGVREPLLGIAGNRSTSPLEEVCSATAWPWPMAGKVVKRRPSVRRTFYLLRMATVMCKCPCSRMNNYRLSGFDKTVEYMEYATSGYIFIRNGYKLMRRNTIAHALTWRHNGTYPSILSWRIVRIC